MGKDSHRGVPGSTRFRISAEGTELGGKPTGSNEMLVQRREHSKSEIKISVRSIRSSCIFYNVLQ